MSACHAGRLVGNPTPVGSVDLQCSLLVIVNYTIFMLSPATAPFFGRTTELIKRILSFSLASSTSLRRALNGKQRKDVPSLAVDRESFFEQKVGIWFNMSTCHTLRFLESYVSLVLYLSRDDRTRCPPLSSTHTTASPASSGFPFAPLVRSHGFLRVSCPPYTT